MKNKIIFATVFFLVCFCLSPLLANGQQESNSESSELKASKSVTVTDFLGREVTVQTPIKTVAFTHYSTAEALKVLNAWELVVGRDGYTGNKLLYPNIDEIPALGEMMAGPYTPNMEKLLELSPDLLILEVIPSPGMDDLIKKLDGIIPVVTVKTYDPEEMFHSFDILGKLLNREDEAKTFTSWVKNIQTTLLDKVGELPDSEKTTIFYKTGYGSVDEIGTFSDAMTYVPARNKFAGCINIASDIPSQGGWISAVDPEWLASKDIELLIIGDPQPNGYGALIEDPSNLASFREQVMKLPVFAETSAVKTEKVYMLADEFFGTPRHIVGFTYLAKWAHPDLFEDLDPAVINQEYFNKFLRLDVDVINHGYFVYPKE